MTKLTNLIAAVVLLFYGTALFAQYGTPAQQQTPQQSTPEQRRTSPPAIQPKQTGAGWQVGKKATFTGCLESSTIGALTGAVKKEASKEFILKRQGTGQEITVKGLPALAQHTDHMVQLTGTMAREDGKNVFNVSQIKHVANSCAEKPGLGKATGQTQEKPKGAY